jgi:hypothetical protein
MKSVSFLRYYFRTDGHTAPPQTVSETCLKCSSQAVEAYRVVRC